METSPSVIPQSAVAGPIAASDGLIATADKLIANADKSVKSFPLERPRLRLRRRDSLAQVSSLAHFVVGPENRLAGFLATSREDPFALGNPLLVVGGTGVGKTLLAFHFAARAAILRGTVEGPSEVSYLPAVDFARRYADAVEADDLISFRDELDEACVLVIDDLHQISHKSPAQNELASRIETRCGEERPTVLTCRRQPPEIRGFRSRLVSRVLSGLTVPIRPPERDARRLLLHEFSLLHGVEIEPALLDVLEEGLAKGLSLRLLEGSIKQMDLWSRMNGSTPNIDAVQSVLASIGETRSMTIATISLAVGRYFRVNSSELKSGSRRQSIVRARSLAMWLSRRLTSCSLHQIGDHFGGRDHSTVLHAIRKTESLIAVDGDLRRAADELTEKLTE